MLDANRTEYGKQRTVCDCRYCTINCEHIPGYLIPSDLERIRESLGYADLGQMGAENLLASPGATVLNTSTGATFRIGTLVPARKADGTCKFLTNDKKCSIHPAAPFGCAFFDAHQSQEDADILSSQGLRDIQRDHSSGGDYSLLWFYLMKLGRTAPSPTECRVAMKRAMDAEGL